MTKDETIAASVPADIRSAGTLRVAMDASYPPFDFVDTDNKTLIGFDPDLSRAIGKVLGLKVELTNTPFDGIIPGLQAKRFDLGISAFTDTKVREKVVDFVTYFEGGTTLMVPAGNPDKLDLFTLCGRTIALKKGTIYESTVLPALSKECTDAGKPAIKGPVYPGPESILAVSSGRADGTISDYAPLAYVAKESAGKFDVLPDQYMPAPWGVAVPKESGMAEPVQAAIKNLMETGEYDKIIDKWGVSVGKVEDSMINAAVN